MRCSSVCRGSQQVNSTISSRLASLGLAKAIDLKSSTFSSKFIAITSLLIRVSKVKEEGPLNLFTYIQGFQRPFLRVLLRQLRQEIYLALEIILLFRFLYFTNLNQLFSLEYQVYCLLRYRVSYTAILHSRDQKGLINELFLFSGTVESIAF